MIAPRTRDSYEQLMRMFGFWLGIGLLAVGAVTALAERVGTPSTISIGSIWAKINANSLVGFQSLIENHVAIWLWPPIQFLLTLPAWMILGAAGLVLVLACRSRARA